jgi:hypothetical protein
MGRDFLHRESRLFGWKSRQTLGSACSAGESLERLIASLLDLGCAPVDTGVESGRLRTGSSDGVAGEGLRRSFVVDDLSKNPRFDDLRGDARFQRLMARVGLN